MPCFARSEPAFWRVSPPALADTTVFAEAVDHRVANFVLGDDDGVLTLEIISRQAGLHPVHESPKPASKEVTELIDRLRAG